MNLRKKPVIFIVIFILLFAIVGFAQLAIRQKVNLNLPKFKARDLSAPEVTPEALLESSNSIIVTIDFTNNKVLSGKVEAGDAYEALEKLAKARGIELGTKQFKYGLLVNKIGKRENSKEAFWSYSVNGKLGNIAADRYIVHPGDKVEWVYKKINR